MKVDVLMPTYNRAILVNGITLLERAIISFLEQDYDDARLLIYDDGSTDNTPYILGKYQKHPRINMIIGIANRKPPHNMNYMWDFAKAPLICQLHDDDQMTPNSISVRVKKFIDKPDLQAVYGGWTTQDINENNFTYYNPGKPDAERIIKEEYINFTTLMHKRDIPFRFDAELRYYFDWLFKIRLLNECKVDYVSDSVMLHTVHKGQETQQCRILGMNAPDEKLMREKLLRLSL
jgi:glycosyltransferase involved in cell wall biosynthesis